MDSSFYSNPGLNDRRRALFTVFMRDAAPFRADGRARFKAANNRSYAREYLWSCCAYLFAAEQWADHSAGETAEAALRRLTVPEDDDWEFTVCAATHILGRFANLIPEEAAAALGDYCSRRLEPTVSSRRLFVGVNDNKPAMTTAALLAYGRYAGRRDLFARGVAAVDEIAAHLEHFDTVSEFNSPTYTPITLASFALAADLCGDPTVRKRALQVEARLWHNVLSTYHPIIQRLGGPHSRAYLIDCCAGPHNTENVLSAAVGPALAYDPARELFETYDSRSLRIDHLSRAFLQRQAVWMHAVDYHLPESEYAEFTDRRFPHTVTMTSVASDFSETRGAASVVYHNGVNQCSTYAESDFSVGVCTHEFATGVSTNSLYAVWVRSTGTDRGADGGVDHGPVSGSDAARAAQQVGSLTTRYVANDRRPNETYRYPEGREVPKHNYQDEGRKTAVLVGGDAVVVYQPKEMLHIEPAVSSLKLSILFAGLPGLVDEIWIGNSRVQQLPTASGISTPVFVRSGGVFIAVVPLPATRLGGEKAVEVIDGPFGPIVSFYNYNGAPTRFDRETLARTTNGVGVRVRSARKGLGFAEFRALPQLSADTYVTAMDVTTEVVSEREHVDIRRRLHGGDCKAVTRGA